VYLQYFAADWLVGSLLDLLFHKASNGRIPPLIDRFTSRFVAGIGYVRFAEFGFFGASMLWVLACSSPSVPSHGRLTRTAHHGGGVQLQSTNLSLP
jgi:hypothetical protein